MMPLYCAGLLLDAGGHGHLLQAGGHLGLGVRPAGAVRVERSSSHRIEYFILAHVDTVMYGTSLKSQNSVNCFRFSFVNISDLSPWTRH